MRKKKIISFIAAACLLLLSTAAGMGIKEIKAATAVKLEISSANGYGNDTVSVDINLSENPGISGITLGIRYDKAVLEVEEVITSDEVFKSEAAVQPNGDGFVGYSNATGNGDYTATGKLMTVKFKIKDGAAAGDTALIIGNAGGVLEASDFAGETIAVAAVSGKITVNGKDAVTPGDEDNAGDEDNTGNEDNTSDEDNTGNKDNTGNEDNTNDENITSGENITGDKNSTDTNVSAGIAGNTNIMENPKITDKEAEIPVQSVINEKNGDIDNADGNEGVKTGDKSGMSIVSIFMTTLLSGILAFMALRKKAEV